MINSIGLPNKGLEGFLAEDLPQLAELPVPLIVSVMATSPRSSRGWSTAVAERDEVAAIELNVSCPNVHSGLIVGEQPAETAALLEALRPLTEKPLIVKLTPNVADPAAVAVAAEEGGADAVSLINTLKASAIDPRDAAARARRPATAASPGRRSGRSRSRRSAPSPRRSACRSSAWAGSRAARDALEFLAAGATLVAVGTESFRDPRAGSRGSPRSSSERSLQRGRRRVRSLDLELEV